MFEVNKMRHDEIVNGPKNFLLETKQLQSQLPNNKIL